MAVFREVPDGQFVSPFPSDDALSDPKLQAILAAANGKTTLGAALLTQAGAQAWNFATQVLWKNKATLAGDVTQELFRRVAWIANNDAVRGVVAEVPFLLSTDPKVQLGALARVGVDVALAACSAVPLAGWIVGLVVGVARVIASIWTSGQEEDRTVRLPWATYVQGSDEAATGAIVRTLSAASDWTSIFSPPTDAVPWRLAEGLDAQARVVGSIFAPVTPGSEGLNESTIAWSGGFGVLPGSFRIAGTIQSRRSPQPSDDLLRYYNTGQLIRIGDSLSNTGDFYPFTAQTAGQLWQQAVRPGSPDAFKIDAGALLSAWVDWCDALYSSAMDQGLGDLLLPYLAHEVHGEQVMGVDGAGVLRPQTEDGQLVPLVTPDIWSAGLATPATRTRCFFQENSRTRAQATFPGPWPRLEGAPTAPPAPNRLARGRQCVPWPPGELLLARYRRIDTAIILPALQQLQQVQRASLARSLVCAYVRPDDVGDLPRYAAFADPALRARCLELRQLLLQHPSRFYVDLATAQAVDPTFAAALEDSGVTPLSAGAPKQLVGKQLPDGPLPDTPAPPPATPPGGGLPFAPKRRGRGGAGAGKSSGSGALVLGGAAALAAIGLAVGLRGRS